MRRAVSSLIVASFLVSCVALPPPQEWFAQPTHGQPRTILNVPGRERKLDAEPIAALAWEQAVALARENSPTALAAGERIQRADARIREAKSFAWPRLDFRGGYLQYVEVPSFFGAGSDIGSGTLPTLFASSGAGVYSGGFDLSYPVFDGGEAYYERGAAAAEKRATEEDRQAILRELELQVCASFLGILLAEESVRIAENALEFTQEQVRQARAKEDVGEGLRVDRLRFSTRASEQQLGLNRARADRRIQVAVLSELVGVELSEDVVLVRPDFAPSEQIEASIALALARRPELRALRARIEAATNDLSREQASWWPGIDLQASYGFISLDELKWGDETDELRVGGGLTWNLFRGGATVARASAARHFIEELRFQERELALRIERELREAEIELTVARENLDVSREAVELAEEVLERISAQYAEGEAQVIDVNDAELQRTRSQLASLRSLVSYFLAQVRLRRAMGIPVDAQPHAIVDELPGS